MTDELTTRLDKLAEDVAKLKNKGKDPWDKFQILAALLIPATIALVGSMVSTSLKEAEIASAQKAAAGQEAVARVNARVGQASLVKSFMDALLSEEPRTRKLAIEAILIALPEDGPRLVKMVEETDPNAEVRIVAVSALLQPRRESAAAFVKSLSREQLDLLAKALGVRTGADALADVLTAISRASSSRDFDLIAQKIKILFGKEI